MRRGRGSSGGEGGWVSEGDAWTGEDGGGTSAVLGTDSQNTSTLMGPRAVCRVTDMLDYSAATLREVEVVCDRREWWEWGV
jgi:hypothetical protein